MSNVFEQIAFYCHLEVIGALGHAVVFFGVLELY
jgi:hypothetical protein